MPVSATENKDIAKQWIDELKPRRVLDIGVGEGTYSLLARTEDQYWYGIEAYYPYVEKYNLKSKYDSLIIGDARYIDYGKLPPMSLVIAADFIEHMTRNQAKSLIEELLQHTQYLLICFPVLHLDQHDDSNQFEDHVDHWSDQQMSDYLDSIGAEVYKHVVGDILSYYLVSGG